MAKLGAILALLVTAVLLAALPRMAEAQGEPPHVFVGIAKINGVPAPVGSEVTAWDEDWLIGSTLTGPGGEFTIQVSRAAAPISFQVNGLDAQEVYPHWILGEVTRDFDLTAIGSGQHTPDIPHIFTGSATINGFPAPVGTEVRAWGEERIIGATQTGPRGEFAIEVSRAAGPISFQLNDWWAKELAPEWIAGGITPDFALTVTGTVVYPEDYLRLGPDPGPGKSPIIGPQPTPMEPPAAEREPLPTAPPAAPRDTSRQEQPAPPGLHPATIAAIITAVIALALAAGLLLTLRRRR